MKWNANGMRVAFACRSRSTRGHCLSTCGSRPSPILSPTGARLPIFTDLPGVLFLRNVLCAHWVTLLLNDVTLKRHRESGRWDLLALLGAQLLSSTARRGHEAAVRHILLHRVTGFLLLDTCNMSASLLCNCTCICHRIR